MNARILLAILTLAGPTQLCMALQARPDSQAPSTSPPPAAPPPALKPVLAEDVYKNVQIFKGKPATVLLPAMLAIRGLIGVDCTYCHTPYNWEKDDSPQKPKTRQMFEMMGYIDKNFFAGENKVSCWTCHRGEPKPTFFKPDPEITKLANQSITIAPGDEKKPAEQVFKDIEMLKGVPAERLPAIMAFFSASLGVRCTHCHVESAYEKDKAEKKRAREMLSMVHDTLTKYYNGNGPIGCFGCHHGQTKPELEGRKPAIGSSGF